MDAFNTPSVQAVSGERQHESLRSVPLEGDASFPPQAMQHQQPPLSIAAADTRLELSARLHTGDRPLRPRRRSSLDRLRMQSQSAQTLSAPTSQTHMLSAPLAHGAGNPRSMAEIPSARHALNHGSSRTRFSRPDPPNGPLDALASQETLVRRASASAPAPRPDTALPRPKSLFEQHSDSSLQAPQNAQAASPDRSMSPFYSKFSRSRSRSAFVADQPNMSDDQVGVTAPVMVWCSNYRPPASALSRNPMFREASNSRHRLSKAGSSRPQDEIGPDTNFERAAGFRGSAPSWLRERPSKSRLNQQSSSTNQTGQWKKATATFQDSGMLLLVGEDRGTLHSLDCCSLFTSDVQPVHESLFGRPHVLGIYPKTFRTSSEAAIDIRSSDTASRGEQIFMEFGANVQLQYWLTLFRIYMQPELFDSADSVHQTGSHRFYRQIDMTIHEAKTIMPRWPSELLEAPKSPLHASTAHGGGQSSFAGGAHVTPQKSVTRKQDDYDGSPGSESCSSRGGSRSGSRSNSRSGSRVRHNTKTSLSNFQSQDTDDGSGSSRAGSHIAPDAHSFISDDTSSMEERVHTLLNTGNDASRYLNEDYGHLHSYSTVPVKRRDERDLFEGMLFDRYCRIRLDDDILARTSLRPSNNANAFKTEKFSLRDLPASNMLVIEVLHPTQKTTTNVAGMSANASSKYMLLGVVEIPLDTLRRNEEIEGRFPIWSISTFPTNALQQSNDDDGKLPTSFHRGVVGELKLTLKMREDTILLLSQYEHIQQSINAPDAAHLIKGLASTLREDVVIAHLTRIFAASGTITDSISALIELESSEWGDKLQPELLFRANTLLSRFVDHFQRLVAPMWLDDCLGATVRKICNEPEIERSDTPSSDSGHDTGKRTPSASQSNLLQSLPEGPVHAQTLRTLSEILWHNIYSQRHRCPADLRMVLHRIRSKVNDRFKLSRSTRPGIQGVGAFIFLRLFCAALNAPQLYGLTTSQPGRVAQRKLLLLSKVLLAMASKRVAFDQDKDSELVPLNDFLRNYSSAYDDYITVVSTEPPKTTNTDRLGFRYDDDEAIQNAVQQRLPRLLPLHRESLPCAPYMLDQSLAIASFVSYVVNAMEESTAVRSTWTAGGQRFDDHDCARDPHECDHSEAHELSRKRSIVQKKVDEFVALCSNVEEMAGHCVEAAGYDPKMVPVALLRNGADTAGEHGSLAMQGDATPSYVEGHAVQSSSASHAEELASLINRRTVDLNGRQIDKKTASPSRSRRATINSGYIRSGFSSPSRASPTPRNADDTLDASFAQSSNRKNAASPLGSDSESSFPKTAVRREDPAFGVEQLGRAQSERTTDEVQQRNAALGHQAPTTRDRAEAIRQISRARASSTTSIILPIHAEDAWTSQRSNVLLEADDGSTFEHVSSSPRAVVPRGLVRGAAIAPSQPQASEGVVRPARKPVSTYIAAREMTSLGDRPNGERRHSSGLYMAASAPHPSSLSSPRGSEPDALKRSGFAIRSARGQLSDTSTGSDLSGLPPMPHSPGAGAGEKKKKWWKP